MTGNGALFCQILCLYIRPSRKIVGDNTPGISTMCEWRPVKGDSWMLEGLAGTFTGPIIESLLSDSAAVCRCKTSVSCYTNTEK